MRLFRCFNSLLFLILICPSAFAATSNFSTKSTRDFAHRIEAPRPTLQVGETIRMDVFWMGIPVGEGILEVREKIIRDGRPAFHLVATAHTNDFLSKIYPVEDRLESFMDAEGFHSLGFRKTVQEGRYRADEEIRYDYQNGKAVYHSFKNGSEKIFKIDGPVHDILSAFYWFRLQSVQCGQSLRTTVNDEEKNWALELQALRLENKEFKGGRVIETFLVEPRTRLKGILYRRGRTWVNFTTDSSRTPVSIRISTPFGPIVGISK